MQEEEAEYLIIFQSEPVRPVPKSQFFGLQ